MQQERNSATCLSGLNKVHDKDTIILLVPIGGLPSICKVGQCHKIFYGAYRQTLYSQDRSFLNPSRARGKEKILKV